MEILGHSQITLTLGTYSHVVPELARDAADKMGAALWGAAPNGHRNGTGMGKDDQGATVHALTDPGNSDSQSVGPAGLEPATYGLKVRSSAN